MLGYNFCCLIESISGRFMVREDGRKSDDLLIFNLIKHWRFSLEGYVPVEEIIMPFSRKYKNCISPFIRMCTQWRRQVLQSGVSPVTSNY
jgi:hypothetical protein